MFSDLNKIPEKPKLSERKVSVEPNFGLRSKGNI